MAVCRECGERRTAEIIGLCPDCLRNLSESTELVSIHAPVRRRYGLPLLPPESKGGLSCSLCSNNCTMAVGEKGYCGIRKNKNGRLKSLAPKGSALAHTYLDPLPTNCCAAWFCSGTKERGCNLAVFFYGCNFDCLFCQNASHKLLDNAPLVTEDEMLRSALDPRIRCVCFFGGSPEPQLGFALRVSRRIIEQSGNKKHICWEWNGCGNPDLVREAAKLSFVSGGTVKFDLKAFSTTISCALCGVDTSRSFENFSMLAKLYAQRNLLTATTLLVPFYVDKYEVGSIARFIASMNPEIPYQLLVFHPDFFLKDLPVTPKEQVDECYRQAKKHLSRVSIGNENLYEKFI